MSIESEKAALRARMRAERLALNLKQRQAAEAALAARLLDMSCFGAVHYLGIYHSYGSELSLDKAILTLTEKYPDICPVYPLVRNKEEMDFAPLSADEAATLLADPKKAVDSAKHYKFLSPLKLDCMLVPGLAFTRNGSRLGQGGGYYDRYMKRIRPQCLTIGVCFYQQLLDSLPTQASDVALDLVVAV